VIIRSLACVSDLSHVGLLRTEQTWLICCAEVVPPPLATPYYNANYGLGDHQHSRRVLEKLSAGATSAENASKRCQQTIRDVRKLLDAENLTRYHFKKPRHIQPSSSANAHTHHPAPALSPFAKMVLGTTEVPFRYLTPESPGTQSSLNGNRSSKSKAHEQVPTPPSVINSRLTPQDGLQPPLLPVPDPHALPSSQVLQAVVPRALSASELAGVQYISDSRVQPSGRSQNMTSNGSRTISVDQRQKGDAAVIALQSLLHEIFSADDIFDPDVTQHSGYLAVAETDDGRVSTIQPGVQDTLDAAVQAVEKYTCLDGIPIEDVLRVQKLNERAVSSANSLQLAIGSDWSPEDEQFWLHKVEQAGSGLLAARTMLRIMNAGRQEKELQSEDHLRVVLDLLKTVIDTAIIPIVQERSFVGEKIRGGDKPQHNPKFVIATNYRTHLKVLLTGVTRLFRLFAKLLARVDVDESAISSIVYMSKSLIFAENAATDKESVFGIQPFESTRKFAMDVLGRIFTRYPNQRQYVIDEVLTSLEKLPATKQSARQYRLHDGKAIQLVSALLMRFVQTSAIRNSTALHLRTNAGDDDEEDADGSDEDMKDEESEDEIQGSISVNNRGAPKDLASVIKDQHEAASNNARYIVTALINRASKTAKNSDEPYRKLMDIFTEDFLSVLGSSDWPAAELLLRMMLTSFIGLAEDPKKPVPARNLGLELMGTMGSSILALQLQTRNASRNVDPDESPLVNTMLSSFRNAEANNKDVDSNDLLGFNGPYRFVLEYLRARDNGSDAQLQTAKGFLLVQWANQLCTARAGSIDSENSDMPDKSKDLKDKLRNMIVDPQWLEENYEFQTPSTATGKFASLLVTINLVFCKAFPRLFNALVNALSDDHTQVKSRGIRSILAVVEMDPDVLARNLNLLAKIVSCMDDKSAMVRDTALGLIQRSLALRPDLAARLQPHVQKRTADQTPGVRKKAYKVLKDLYVANDGPVKSSLQADSQLGVRVGVANTLIEGMEDSDDSVLELVRTILEELWFSPFHGLSLQGDNTVQNKRRYHYQAQLLMRCISYGRAGGREIEVCTRMESLVREVLTKSKTAPANERVCKILIGVLFEAIIDPTDLPGSPSPDVILMTLTIFARACPTLMEAAQLELLEPYTNNLTQNDDLDVYRSVLTILRHAMPHVKNLSHETLTLLQNSLLKSINRMPRPELPGVAACLWTIANELGSTQRLVTMVASALDSIQKTGQTDFASDALAVRRLIKLMGIAGQFGKVCDFEEQLVFFQEKFPKLKTSTVAGLAIQIICPFTATAQPLNIREAALDAICSIAQRWPKMFLRDDVAKAFSKILKEKAHSLEEIFVSGLEGFFASLSTPTESQQEEATAPVTGRERLAKTYIATDQDGASSELAQKFLTDIIRIAESSADDLALTATKLIASILQQGLPHPKECGPTLVALETSPNAMIAHVAWKEHRVMHQKHETTIEKEYVRSIQRSLTYQQNVAQDTSGFTGVPAKPKLHYFWDVLKAGKLKVRHKFLGNIVQKLEFEPARLKIRTDTPPELMLARYVCENLALFDYDRTDDLTKLLFALEKMFASVGTPVAQSIESEILKLNVSSMLAPDPMAIGTMIGETTDTSISPTRLKALALSSQILLVVAETRNYIIRLWNLQKIARNSKAAPKENSKAPARATTAPHLTENYIRTIATLMYADATPEQQHIRCEQFVEVMNVDSEAKLPSDDEDEITVGGGEASDSEGRSATPPGGKTRKRKSAGSMQTTPRKRGRLRKSSVSKAKEDDDDGGWA
jgi:cohesin loading factor subunit SCC2